MQNKTYKAPNKQEQKTQLFKHTGLWTAEYLKQRENVLCIKVSKKL